MKRLRKIILILSGLILGFALIGCGFIQDDVEAPESGTYYYNPGEAVEALGYSDSRTIRLFLLNDGGSESDISAFREIVNGEYLLKGVHTIGVSITPQDESGNIRVFVGDGGWDYQVEASLNLNSGLYVCDFAFQGPGTYLTHPVLVQAVTPEGTASKEKFVVTTYPGLRPESGMLVQEGMGISLSAALLDSLKGAMAGMLGDSGDIEIKEFGPAPYTEGSEGIFHIDAGIMSFDIAMYDTYTNGDGDVLRGVSTKLVNVSGGTPDPDSVMERIMSFLFDFMGEFLVNSMGLSETAVGPVAISFADLMAGMTTEDTSSSDDSMADLMEDMSMDTTLFLNLYGLPEETTEDFAMIGGGIYGVDPGLVETDADGLPVWPEVVLDTTDTGMNMEKIKNDGTGMGIALSRYNLNHMLSEMMRGLEIRIKDVQEMGIPIFSPQNPNNALDIIMTVNPGGAAIDMTPVGSRSAATGVFAVNDMRLELIEGDIPVAELSMDLNMAVDISLVLENDEYQLELTMTPDYTRSYFHVLKDDLGVSAIDHSRMVEVLFTLLTGPDSDSMVLPLPLGMTHKTGAEVIPVEFDENGNCFMNLAVETLDTSAIPGCFIGTASD